MAIVALIGALDIGGAECVWLAEQLDKHRIQALFVDVGSFSASLLASVSSDDVVTAADSDTAALRKRRDRDEMMQVMGAGVTRIVCDLAVSRRIRGLLALRGSGGSLVVTAAMQAPPVGFPKLLVSITASGDVKLYAGEADTTLMYSAVDVAGINSVSPQVFTNAAATIAGMAQVCEDQLAAIPTGHKPVIAVAMFGMTTPVADEARDTLTDLGYEMLVFRATGAGGRAMEKLAEPGPLAEVYDLTTTELTDDLVDSILSMGPRRLEMAGRVDLPQAVSLGVLDTVNLGPADAVPSEFTGCNLFIHNPTVTPMRTTPEEMAELGRRTVVKLAAVTGPTKLFIPLRGVSTVDVEEAPFQDAETDAALFAELRVGLVGSGVVVHELDQAINNPGFGAVIARALHTSIIN